MGGSGVQASGLAWPCRRNPLNQTEPQAGPLCLPPDGHDLLASLPDRLGGRGPGLF